MIWCASTRTAQTTSHCHKRGTCAPRADRESLRGANRKKRAHTQMILQTLAVDQTVRAVLVPSGKGETERLQTHHEPAGKCGMTQWNIGKKTGTRKRKLRLGPFCFSPRRHIA